MLSKRYTSGWHGGELAEATGAGAPTATIMPNTRAFDHRAGSRRTAPSAPFQRFDRIPTSRYRQSSRTPAPDVGRRSWRRGARERRRRRLRATGDSTPRSTSFAPGLFADGGRRHLRRGGLTKGAFYHFASKEACHRRGAGFRRARRRPIGAAAGGALPDPAGRALELLHFRQAILLGELPQFTWLVGTMVQEA